MARSHGPSRGKGDKSAERRPGKGSPWANARSKSAESRSRRDKASTSRNAPKSQSSSERGTASQRQHGRSGSGDVSPAQEVLSAAEEPDNAGSVDPSLPTVKLQKLLADTGLGSRRELERWIAAGRVSVNGVQATLGDRVTGTERIDVDGKALGARARSTGSHARVLLLNKSEGVICTRRDPEGRKTVFADLPTLRGGRWISVGRLDVATTGLLLLTNDGELANRMMHPSTGLDREYAVRTDVVLEDDQLVTLKKGIDSEGETLRFADIRYFDGRGANHWYHVVLLEGKNHEVRRLFASVGAEVRRLKRVRYGPVLLPSWLRRGQRFELNNRDVAALYKTLGLQADLPPERPGRRNDRRGMADRSVLIPYPELPGVAAGATAATAEAEASGAGTAEKETWGKRSDAERKPRKKSARETSKKINKRTRTSPGKTRGGKTGASKTGASKVGSGKDWRKR